MAITQITKLNVLKLLNTHQNFNLARRYYTQDKVKEFSVDRKGTHHYVKGVVDVGESTFQCEFVFTPSGRLVNYSCDCHFCHEGQPCAHIGAIMLKMNNTYLHKIPFSYSREKEKKNAFDFEAWLKDQLRTKAEKERLEKERREHERKIMEERIRQEREMLEKMRMKTLQDEMARYIEKQKEDFTSMILTQVDTNSYTLYPEVTKQNRNFYLSYRIGDEKKKYVIKNLSNLVSSFEIGEIVAYGKNYAIAHDKERFDDFSKQQIDFISQVTRFPVRSYAQYSYYAGGKMIVMDTNRIGFLHAFFETYKDKTYPTFKVIDVKDKIKMILKDQGESYGLELVADECRVIDGNEMFLFPQTDEAPYLFKRVLLDSYGKVVKLLRMCDKHEQDTLYISKENWPDFYKYIIQPIELYLDIENMVEEEKTYETIQFYADVNDLGEIEGRLYYVDKKLNKRLGFQETHLDYCQEVVETVLKQYAREINDGLILFDGDDKRNIEFFTDGIIRLQEFCEVYISEALKNINKKASHTITVGVRMQNDLLSIDISSLDFPKEEIANILSAYRRKKKFYRLKNGQMVKLDSDELEALNEFVEDYHLDLKDLKKDEIVFEKNRMFSLENNQDLIVSKDETFKHQLEQFTTLSQQEIQIPEAYETILRDYQKEGYRWLYTMHQYGFNGILADDMGLGKTLQVISLLEGIDSKQPSIVVCPASLIYNWEDEVHKFSRKLKVGCVVGNKNNRLDILNNYQDYDLLVTSYDYIRRDQEDYESLSFEYVILDEAQFIKNKNTKNAIAAKSLKANHRLALTGTPIENTLAELWSIFDFLMPNYLFNYNYFKKNYETPIVKGGNTDISNKLKKMVSPFILRRNKTEVLKELPDKIETVQVIPFNEEEYKLYIASLSQASEQLQSMFDSPNIDQMMILAMLTRLRQLCIEPRLVYEDISEVSSKMTALFELLMQLKENNQKTLVFSSFPSVFTYIEKVLHRQHISYQVLTGGTSKEERRMMVEKFQEGNIDVFLVSLKAGGTGLNLTEASAVIHIDPWWNFSAQNQATDRAYRIGQKNTVHVFKLVMKNSIEEKIVKLQEMKKELADAFVENNHGGIASMGKEEILDLFKVDSGVKMEIDGRL